MASMSAEETARPLPPGFAAAVETWLTGTVGDPASPSPLYARAVARLRGPVRVLDVKTEGYEAGDTDCGFYDVSETVITYVDHEGQRRAFRAAGVDLASLWNHVMHAWPTTSGDSR